jgi:hypothetical protein
VLFVRFVFSLLYTIQWYRIAWSQVTLIFMFLIRVLVFEKHTNMPVFGDTDALNARFQSLPDNGTILLLIVGRKCH